MGEASRRKKAAAAAPTVTLGQRFEALGIDTSAPGFYDDPAFLREEEKHKKFLETYAQWVLDRPLTSNDEAKVRDILPRLAEIVRMRLDRHKWYAGCLPVTSMVSRMLDRMGVWNCVFRGSASILDHEKKEVRRFAMVDEHEGEGFETGHMWLSVPPFPIVDLTLRHQRWGGDYFEEIVPATIIGEASEIIRLETDDVIASSVVNVHARREGRKDPQLYARLLKDQARFSKLFPPRKLVIGSLELRYVPSGVSASDVPLEQININGRTGVPAVQIWREDVIPAFGLPAGS